MKKLLALALLIPLAACTSWETETYKTLAASQAVINQAQADYEVSAKIPGGDCTYMSTGAPVACLPHSMAVYTAINKAKAGQTAAVNAFAAYEEAKAAGGTQANLTALQTDVTVALEALPGEIASIKALY